MASPLGIIYQMLSLLIENTLNTFAGIFDLFGQLMGSLGLVASVGGPLGFLLSTGIMLLVGYFLLKYFFRGGKKLIILILVAVVIAYIIILSALV